MKKIAIIFIMIISAVMFPPERSHSTSSYALFSAFGSYSNPIGGDLNSDYDSSFNGGGISFGGVSFLGLGGEFTLSRYGFDGKNSEDDETIDSVGYHFGIYGPPDYYAAPFFRLGIAHYFYDKGSSGTGLNTGLGMFHKIPGKLNLSFTYSAIYHYVFNGGDDFFEVRAGLVYYIKKVWPKTYRRRHKLPPPKADPRKEE